MPCQCTAVGLQRQPQQVKVLPPPQQLQQLEIDLPLALGLLDPPPLMDPPLSLDQLPASSRTQQTALPAQMEGAGQRPAGVAEGAGLGKQQWQGKARRYRCNDSAERAKEHDMHDLRRGQGSGEDGKHESRGADNGSGQDPPTGQRSLVNESHGKHTGKSAQRDDGPDGGTRDQFIELASGKTR